ncbi:hypothetical protein N2152v2_008886 [Parachlorella kessleri]
MKAPRVLGIVYIVLVALIWVAAAFVIQRAQATGVSVVVLTFIVNALFTIYLPLYWLLMHLERRRQAGQEGDVQPLLTDRGNGSGSAGNEGLGGMTRWQVFRAALVIGPLWFVAQLVYNLSLANTSVTSNTVLSSTSSFFAYLISMWLLSEAFSRKKLACILLLITGTAVYTLGDTKSAEGDAANETLFGDFLVLAAAVLYACYTVAIRKALTDDRHTTMILLFGLQGTVILFGLGPLLLVAWMAGAGLGSLSWESFGIVSLMGLVDNVLSDYLYAQAVVLAGPTIASAGLSLQVPVAVLSDGLVRRPAWLGKPVPAALTLTGGALVLAGFLGVNLSGSSTEPVKEGAAEATSSCADAASLSPKAQPADMEGGASLPLGSRRSSLALSSRRGSGPTFLPVPRLGVSPAKSGGLPSLYSGSWGQESH